MTNDRKELMVAVPVLSKGRRTLQVVAYPIC